MSGVRYQGVRMLAGKTETSVMRVLRVVWMVALGFAMAVPVAAQTTTVFLVRHAEKGGDPSERDPVLSDAGVARAATLADMLREVGISTIYSTPFIRTQETARPLADRLGLEITSIQPTRTHIQDLAVTLREQHGGETVLVVGHSNTIPGIVNALGAGPYENLTEEEYDDLFVVTLEADGTASVLRLHYGVRTP